MAIAGLAASAVTAQTTPPPPPPIGLSAAIKINLSITETGDGKTEGPSANTTVHTKFATTHLNTKDVLRSLNDKNALVPNIASWDLVAVLPEATEISTDYRFYLVKTGETPVLIPSDKLSLTVDAAAYAYREQSSEGVLTGGSGKFQYAITLTAGDVVAHGTASGAYTVRSVTVNGTTSTLVIPSAVVVRITGVKDNGDTEAAGVVEGQIVLTAHKPTDLSTYPVPAPAPAPTPAPTP